MDLLCSLFWLLSPETELENPMLPSLPTLCRSPPPFFTLFSNVHLILYHLEWLLARWQVSADKLIMDLLCSLFWLLSPETELENPMLPSLPTLCSTISRTREYN